MLVPAGTAGMTVKEPTMVETDADGEQALSKATAGAFIAIPVVRKTPALDGMQATQRIRSW